MPGARLACVNVVPTSLIAIDENVDAAGDNIHVERLVALRNFAQPLQLPKGKITYHLLEARDVANAVLEFARVEQGRPPDRRRAYPGRIYRGKVSAKLAAEAPCSVTIVAFGPRRRTRHAGRAPVRTGRANATEIAAP